MRICRRVSDRRFLVLPVATLAGIMFLSGCATKKYVRQQIQTLQPGIQQVQDATQENAERIDAVDKRAQEGITASQAADQRAGEAKQAAQTAQDAAQAAGRKADTANEGIQQANNRMNTLESRVSSINDNYTQSEAQMITFAFNSSTLSEDAKSTLNRIAGDLNARPSGYMVELQGYADSRGSERYNFSLSQRRAEAVERYLVDNKVPLFRVSIVGLGKDNPIADNKTSAGRAENRRVEVRVLKSASIQQTN